MKEFKSFYKEVEGNEGDKCKYNTRLDTYGCGCQHDCNYCYAKSLLDFRGLWDAKEPSVADIEKIEKVIKKIPKGKIIRLGGMTDCFQPLEVQVRNTYNTIKLLNKYRIGYLIVTKSDIVARDEYIEIMDKELAHIQITVTTLDDDFYLKEKYEKASLPSDRIKAILKLQENGFDVAIRLSPLIEEYMDFEKLNGLGINKAIVEFLRVNHWIKKWFNIDYSKHTLKQSGYNHLPLEEKKRILEKIKIPHISVCEDVTEHYEYWKNNFNENKKDCCNLRGVKMEEDGKLKIEYVDIESIKPYEKNAKKHPQEQIEQIKNSIIKFKMIDPIGIWKDEIVEGHGRLIACKQLNFKKVPIIRLDHLTDDERKAYMLAHNKLTMNSDFDAQLLSEELGELFGKIDMNALGFPVQIENIDDYVEGEEEISAELDEANNYVVLQFYTESEWEKAQRVLKLKRVCTNRQNKNVRQKGIGRVIDGAEIIDKLEGLGDLNED